MFDYFRANENEQYLFLQMPLMLIKEEQFKALSAEAKIGYSLYLNRTALSAKNGWIDNQGRVYIIYTLDELMEDLNCCRDKAVKIMRELQEVGLIESIRRGQGLPNILYVMNFATSLKYQTQTGQKSANPVNTLKSDLQTSRSPQNRLQEVRKTDSIYIDYIETDKESKSSQSQTEKFDLEISKTDMTLTPYVDFLAEVDFSEKQKEFSEIPRHPSTRFKENSLLPDYTEYTRLIQGNIEYSTFSLNRQEDIALVDELICCMLDVIFTQGETVKINGENKNRQLVISQYLKINSNDIDHIMDRYKSQHHKITHLHSYLKTMLYTVKQEGDHYYTNAVRADGAVW